VQAKSSIWKDISDNYWLYNRKRVFENVKRRSKSNTVLRAVGLMTRTTSISKPKVVGEEVGEEWI
jgi:hypothetical protein